MADIGSLSPIPPSGPDLYPSDLGVSSRSYFLRSVCLSRLLLILENRSNLGLASSPSVIFLKLASARWILLRSRVSAFCILRLNGDSSLLALSLISLFLSRVGLYLLRVSPSVLLYLLSVCLCILLSRRASSCSKESLPGIILSLENRSDPKSSDLSTN